MSVCEVIDVKDLRTEPHADDNLAFEITLDVAEQLALDIVFRCVYIVDPEAANNDVELESIDVGDGPGVSRGILKFALESRAPTSAEIEAGGGAMEVAGLYLSALYRDAEFCRVGYYVRHEYDNPLLVESPPSVLDCGQLRRVLSDPHVTRFAIGWDSPVSTGGAQTAQEASVNNEQVAEQASGFPAFGAGCVLGAGGMPVEDADATPIFGHATPSFGQGQKARATEEAHRATVAAPVATNTRFHGGGQAEPPGKKARVEERL